jgi:hypothetical protein
MLQVFLSQLGSSSGRYRTGDVHVHVPDADALLAEADAIGDAARQPARLNASHQAEQECVQQVAVCPL